MDKTVLKEAIQTIVCNKQGCRATELFAKIAELYPTEDFNSISVLVNEMIRDEDLIEVEYILPTMNFRVKSILFPKGTEIRIAGSETDIDGEKL